MIQAPPSSQPQVSDSDPMRSLQLTKRLVDSKESVFSFLNSAEEQRQLLEAEASCLSASQQTADNIAALRQKLEKTEADQNSLCDKEQYEEADALDATIQELKDMISRELEEVASGAKKLVIFAENLLGLTRHWWVAGDADRD
eukprot:Skav211296  [mRNA]  locus=scaffold1746:29118:34862:- [translate_table: standard]